MIPFLFTKLIQKEYIQIYNERCLSPDFNM